MRSRLTHAPRALLVVLVMCSVGLAAAALTWPADWAAPFGAVMAFCCVMLGAGFGFGYVTGAEWEAG